MHRLLLAAAILLPLTAAAQPVALDSLAPLPAFRVGVEGDFQPLHSSAPRAYLYSAAATVGMVALGVAANEVARAIDPVAFQEKGRYVIGYVLVGTGLAVGPAVGNWTLGASGDVERAGKVKAAAFAVSGGLLLVAVTATAASAVSQSPAGVSTLEPLTYAALGVAAVGTLIGGAMDLASIPENARDAQRRQRRPIMASAGITASGPGIALRVGL